MDCLKHIHTEVRLERYLDCRHSNCYAECNFDKEEQI